jgi:hypothetical protein
MLSPRIHHSDRQHRNRGPQSVAECDDLLRRVRQHLHKELSEGDRKKFTDFEAQLVKRRQLLFQREQDTFLTGEYKLVQPLPQRWSS